MSFRFRLLRAYSRCRNLITIGKSSKRMSNISHTGLVGTLIYCSAKDQKTEQFQTAILSQPLIKLASVEVVNSSTNMLTQLTIAILDCQDKYREIIEKLLVVLERNLNLEATPEADKMWDKIIALRSQLQEVKKQLNELELQMMSVRNLMDAAAQVAFSAGAEYAGIVANERFLSSSQNIRLKEEELQALEKELIQKEKATITSTVPDDQG